MSDAALTVQLFDLSNIDSLKWPQTKVAQEAQTFLLPLIKYGLGRFVDNIHAKMGALQIGDHVFPLLVSDENYYNSYVCSPFGHYILHGLDSLHLVQNPLIASFIKGLIRGIGFLGKQCHFNSVVYVNNWLFSTDLYPSTLKSIEVEAILTFLKKRFPTHAIIFRSLNERTTSSMLQITKELGFNTLASRQIFITDARDESIFKTRILKSDLKLWKENSFHIREGKDVDPTECKRLLELYHLLYIHDHSPLHPQFREPFMDLIYKGLLRLKVLYFKNEVKGVAAFHVQDEILMCPFFGYDKKDPNSSIIYRLLNTALLLEAKEAGLIFHQSAGASFHKRVRRSIDCLEYKAVYTEHLPLRQRLFWSLLSSFINTLGPHFMKKY